MDRYRKSSSLSGEQPVYTLSTRADQDYTIQGHGEAIAICWHVGGAEEAYNEHYIKERL